MLQHVSIEVRPDQVDACVAFWELLGFAEMEPPPMLRDRFTWVEREGTQIHLVPVDAPVPAREPLLWLLCLWYLWHSRVAKEDARDRDRLRTAVDL